MSDVVSYGLVHCMFHSSCRDMCMTLPKTPVFNYTCIALSLCICLFIPVAKTLASTQVALADLGDFRVSWKVATQVDYLKGQARLGLVNHVPGENYVLKLPFAVQQIKYDIANGDFVQEGQQLATIRGVEVEHFFDAAESIKAIYLATKDNYKASEANYSEKIIQNPDWLALAKNYHQAKLDFAHNQHILSLLSFTDSAPVGLKAPMAGYVQINPNYMDAVEQPLLEILPAQSVFVEVNIPKNSNSLLSHFTVNGETCRLTPVIREQMINRLYQRVWNSFDRDACTLRPGESISVIPHFTFNGFKVSQSSVFRLQDGLYVAARINQTLVVHEVSVHESDGEFHYVTSTTDLHNAQLLDSSVSVLQGILLGMGGE